MFLFSSAKCYPFQSEDDIKSENDEADDMPEVQDTVQFIPGSKLLWRINCRPPNSSQVTVPISLCLALAGDLSRGTLLQCHSLAQDQPLAVLAALKLHSSRLCLGPVLKAALLCLSWHKECMFQVQLGIWGFSLTCLGSLCTEWLKYGYAFSSAGSAVLRKTATGCSNWTAGY